MEEYVQLPLFNEERERELVRRSLAVLDGKGRHNGWQALHEQRDEIEEEIQKRFGEVNQKVIRLLQMPPDQRREWFEAEQKRKREASVESQLGEHEKGVRLKSGAFDRPLEDDDVLRGVAARLNKIASPGGEGTAELDLRDIELPPDTSEGRLYEDAEQSFEEAKEWIIEHTRHVIHLHADLLILDQVLQHARPLLELTRKCISKQKEEHPPNVGGASHEAVILIGTDLIEEMQVFEDGLPGWMLENRETFYRHAGQVVAEERERDERYSNGAVIRWLKQTDCWASERQGKTGPLREVIENVIGYTKEYGDLS